MIVTIAMDPKKVEKRWRLRSNLVLVHLPSLLQYLYLLCYHIALFQKISGISWPTDYRAITTSIASMGKYHIACGKV